MKKYSQQIALNLEILEKADNFTNWLYGEIRPFLNGNILKNNIISKGAMRFFNLLVPFLGFFEKYVTRKSMGISLIVVLEK